MKHLLLPDIQAKEGAPNNHLKWAGRLANEIKPDVITQIGDWWDYPGLSSYDKGTKGLWNKSVVKDFEAGARSVDMFMNELKPAAYKNARLVFTEGNHENRLHRYNHANPNTPQPNRHKEHLEGWGWEVHPFLRPVTVHGVTYCHYFCKGPGGMVSAAGSRNGQPNATKQAEREMRSCVAGHKQGFSFCIYPSENQLIYSMIAGSFYQHDEHYLTEQGHNYWKGVVVLHNVHKGMFSPELYSMKRLRKEFG